MQVLRYMSSVLLFYSLLLIPCHWLNLNLFNCTKIQNEDEWQVAAATWYGPPEGAGSDGGACGYTDSVENPPLSKMVSAGGPPLFRGGNGCGACYQVKCTENAACSRNPVTVTISDLCPSCFLRSVHFDLSGTAFGSMATQGQENNLSQVGQLINILYRRVACSFGNPITFTIDNGANQYNFATEIEYENGDGDLVDIKLKQGNSNTWLPMQRSWGARWALNLGIQLQAPFSIQLTQLRNNYSECIVADNVIPLYWKPAQVYRSAINFSNKNTKCY